MVEGLKRLDRKLTRAIPDRVRRRARAAMEKGAGEIVALARSFCPVDSGALRASIGWTWGDPPEGSLTLAVARSGAEKGGERITVYAGDSTAFYARWVEFGTRAAAPSPFFFPAYRTLRRRVKSRISREITKAIKEGAR